MMWLWDLLVLPLQEYGFMRYGIAVSAIVGVTSATLSCLLVVRQWALMGDAISHAVLLGVVLGWLAARHVGIFWGALIVAVLTGLAITYVERNSRIKLDAAMGILFTFTFALGLAIISVLRPRGIDLFHILFGNVLGVGPSELLLTAVSGGIVLLVVFVLFKEFHLWTFDPVMARTAGLPVGALHYVFTALLSATIVAALQAVGLILVIAMLITPGATAYLLADRLGTMMRIAAAVGFLSAVGGLYGSYYVDVASGPAMVIVASLMFFAAFALAPRRGLVTRAVRRSRMARRTIDEDILKAVYKAEDEQGSRLLDQVADRAGRTVQEVRARVPRLVRRGLMTRDDSGLRASEAGRREALRLVRAHRVLERYLSDAEGVPVEDVHPEAERLEHVVSAKVVDDMHRSLGRPSSDPHGHPIPTQEGLLVEIAGRPLSDVEPGATGRVIMVRDDRGDLLREMWRIGVLPQQEVTVIRRDAAVMHVRIADREAELSAEMAERVFVAVEHPVR